MLLRNVLTLSCFVSWRIWTDAGWWPCGWHLDGSRWCSESVRGWRVTWSKRPEKDSNTSIWQWCSQTQKFIQVWYLLMYISLFQSGWYSSIISRKKWTFVFYADGVSVLCFVLFFSLVNLKIFKEPLYYHNLFRSIKRKKFDDELVESSLVKSSSRVKGPPVMEPVRCSGSEPSSSEKKKVNKTNKSTDYWVNSH